MKTQKLKILLIGPCRTGKTSIANTLADTGPKWKPDAPFKLEATKALRIVEFDITDLNVNNEKLTAEIELWDSSGDDQYRLCWPALRQDTDGVVFVYSKNTSDISRKLEIFYNYFVTQPKLSPRQCLVMHHAIPDEDDNPHIASIKLSPTFARLSQTSVNLTDSVLKLKNEFRVYITSLLTNMRNKKSSDGKKN